MLLAMLGCRHTKVEEEESEKGEKMHLGSAISCHSLGEKSGKTLRKYEGGRRRSLEVCK